MWAAVTIFGHTRTEPFRHVTLMLYSWFLRHPDPDRGSGRHSLTTRHRPEGLGSDVGTTGPPVLA